VNDSDSLEHHSPLPRDRPVTRPDGLGVQSARGFVYLLSGSLVSKAISLVAQISLLYLLSEDEFGVVALAYTVTMFIQILEQAGMGDVLVQRSRFHLWAVPAFWFALALGIFSSALTIAAAPLAAAVYRDPRLIGVMLVLAPSGVFNAISVVPRAKLSRELCFQTLATLNTATITIRMALTVLLAWRGYGPYSFVVPTLIVSALSSAFLWWWARPPWALRPQLARWRFLVADSTRLLGAEWVRVALDQSDYMLLGMFYSPKIVGIYWVGYSFSTQMLQMVSVNVMNILFPALAKLNDRPDEQHQGFLRAQSILSAVGISASLLQAAIAEPLTHMIFPLKWEESVLVMQVLSLGMATRLTAHSSISLLKARGHFHTFLHCLTLFLVLQVVGLLVVLALGGGMLSVALVVATVSTVVCPVFVYAALRLFGGGWTEVAGMLARPTLCGGIAVGTAWVIAQGMERAGYGNLPQLIETVVVAAALNLLLARLWMRPLWDDFWRRCRQLLPVRRGPEPAK
jgi:O-antigen/teichoic acid export membrane protein